MPPPVFVAVVILLLSPVVHGAKKSTNAQFFADTLIKNMILNFRFLMPDSVLIPDLNLIVNRGCSGILTGGGGKVTGLKNVMAKPIVYTPDKDGGVHISIPMHFIDLHIIYSHFAFKCWPFNKKGTADLKLKYNEVHINVLLTGMNQFVDKIMGKQCMFNVESIVFTEAAGMESNIKTDGLTNGFLTSKLFPYVALEIKKDVLQKMSLRVTNKISNVFPASSKTWICRDANLKAIIASTGGPDDTPDTIQNGSGN